jgi:hypothetical protein
MKNKEISQWKLAIWIAVLVVIVGGAFHIIGSLPLIP